MRFSDLNSNKKISPSNYAKMHRYWFPETSDQVYENNYGKRSLLSYNKCIRKISLKKNNIE